MHVAAFLSCSANIQPLHLSKLRMEAALPVASRLKTCRASLRSGHSGKLSVTHARGTPRWHACPQPHLSEVQHHTQRLPWAISQCLSSEHRILENSGSCTISLAPLQKIHKQRSVGKLALAAAVSSSSSLSCPETSRALQVSSCFAIRCACPNTAHRRQAHRTPCRHRVSPGVVHEKNGELHAASACCMETPSIPPSEAKENADTAMYDPT